MLVSLSLLFLHIACVRTSSSSSLEEMEHIVIFMQENRAFDHYFGSLQGVRGFNDRTTIPSSHGHENVFYQPVSTDNEGDYMLPFRVDKDQSNMMCMPAPEMLYETDLKIFNDGRMDAWNTARDPGYGMSYFTREDLPYYYTLYDNFLVGDQYYQSTFTQTNPNRLHLFSGSNGLSVGQEAMLDNTEPRPGFNWTTIAEILEENNVTWQVFIVLILILIHKLMLILIPRYISKLITSMTTLLHGFQSFKSQDLAIIYLTRD